MSKRILRTVPAAILVTTSLAWNLPAAAQGTLATPPSQAASGAVQKSPAPRVGETPRTPPAAGGAAFGGGSALPADLTPAMPASAAAPARPGTPPAAPTGTSPKP